MAMLMAITMKHDDMDDKNGLIHLVIVLVNVFVGAIMGGTVDDASLLLLRWSMMFLLLLFVLVLLFLLLLLLHIA